MVVTWKVLQIDCYPTSLGQTNVVSTVHWECVGVDGDHTGRIYSSTGVSMDEHSTFTPFDQLTEEEVLGWVWGAGVGNVNSGNNTGWFFFSRCGSNG
jgi:hypothetical protein